jgi:DNA-binding NarL/FixJ family response regulator
MNSTPENTPARVLIVDDHAIVRYGMGVMLSSADDIDLCGEAENCAEALKAMQELKPDVAVVDIVLKEENGLDLIRQIRAAGHTQPLLVMSMHNETTHAEKALRAGAQGYIMKENADEVLLDALRTVLSGKLFISDAINEKMLRTYVENEDEEEQSGVGSLTPREKEIFECVGQAMPTRKIAELFNLSPRTVEVHRARIKKKLNCKTSADVLRAAIQWVGNNT